MLMHYAVGTLGVERTRELARSALPDAPVIPYSPSRPSRPRVLAASALHRIADRIGPVEARPELRQA